MLCSCNAGAVVIILTVYLINWVLIRLSTSKFGGHL